MHILIFFAGICLGSIGGFLAALLLLHTRAQGLAEEMASQHQGVDANHGEGTWGRSRDWDQPSNIVATNEVAK